MGLVAAAALPLTLLARASAHSTAQVTAAACLRLSRAVFERATRSLEAWFPGGILTVAPSRPPLEIGSLDARP